MKGTSSTRGSALHAGGPPLATLSIVSHGDGAGLQRLLESLALHEVTGALEIIVTDNLGRNLHDPDFSGWASAYLIRNSKPLGFARNHNNAYRRARGTLFCVLNPDVVFLMPTIGRLAADIQEGVGDILAPAVVDAAGKFQDSYRDLPSPWSLVRRRILGRNEAPTLHAGQIVQSDWVAGIFMLTRAETFGELNGFDERYQLYFEDVDLCTRARLSGRKITVDGAVQVRHDARRASRRLGWPLLRHMHSAARFFLSDPYRKARRLKGSDG